MHRIQELGSGWTEFQGSPADLLEGDVVLDGTAILKNSAVPSKHYNKEGFVGFDLAGVADGAELGRAVLPVKFTIRFHRLTNGEDDVVQQEPEIFEEIVDCGCEEDDCEHEEHAYEWRGPVLNAPKGLMVGINLEPKGTPARLSVKFIDSVYKSGAVVFTDGSAYQSAPQFEWMGWTKERDNGGRAVRYEEVRALS